MNQLHYTAQTDGKSSLFTLWSNDLIASAIHIQTSGKTTYVSMTDSTGFDRGNTLKFIIFVLNSLEGFVVCFSRPKDEFIFGKSSLNPGKKIFGHERLFRLWKYCFMCRCFNCIEKEGEEEMKASKDVKTIEDKEAISNNEIVHNKENSQNEIILDIKDGSNISDSRILSDDKALLDRADDNKILSSDTYDNALLDNTHNRNNRIFTIDPPMNFASNFFITWSNYDTYRGYPYKSISEIDRFEDDPISKMAKKISNLKNLFEGLLASKDFAAGGLLFSNCNCPKSNKLISTHEKCDEIVAFLRKSDFSTRQSALKASKEALESFNFNKVKFDAAAVKQIFRKGFSVSEIKRIIPRAKKQ